MTRLTSALGARLIRVSMLADRGFKRFDQVRSFLITTLATDGTLEAYNDLAYGATRVYDASTPQFRAKLFNWEADLVDRVFPKAPGRVLVGGAGGGREAFELVGRGYEVTAFEPSEVLAKSMAERAEQTGASVEVLLGRYEDMPLLRRHDSPQVVDLRHGPRYCAAMLGWSSFLAHPASADPHGDLEALCGGHRRTRRREFLSQTRPSTPATASDRPPLHAVRTQIRRGYLHAHTSGFFHLSSAEELSAEVEDAGLVIVAASYNDTDGYWPWVAVARPDVAARGSSTPA